MPNKPNQLAIEPYESLTERNNAIIADHVLKGTKYIDLAEKYHLSDRMISRIIIKSANNPYIQSYVDRYWQKSVIDKARTQVLALLDSINPSKMSEGHKATSIGILIDKVRLLQGQATEIKEVRSLDMAELLKVLR